MEGLTLDQAAREIGRSARELRLTIESGDLPAARLGGRWVVDPADLDRLMAAPPPPDPSARPAPPRLAEMPTSAADDHEEPHPVDELLARLETRAVEVATLREQLAARRSPEDARVERLERELSATRMELEQARRRIEELERDSERPPPVRSPGMRDALTPLFERTRAPGEPGPAG